MKLDKNYFTFSLFFRHKKKKQEEIQYINNVRGLPLSQGLTGYFFNDGTQMWSLRTKIYFLYWNIELKCYFYLKLYLKEKTRLFFDRCNFLGDRVLWWIVGPSQLLATMQIAVNLILKINRRSISHLACINLNILTFHHLINKKNI